MRNQAYVGTVGEVRAAIDKARDLWPDLNGQNDGAALKRIIIAWLHSQDPNGRGAQLRQLTQLANQIIAEITLTRAAIEGLKLIQEDIKDGVPVDHWGCGDD